MRVWRLGLLAAMLAAVVFVGCQIERRTYIAGGYPAGPPPAPVYIAQPPRAPAPAYVPPPPAYVPPPAPVPVAAPAEQVQADVEVLTRGPVHEAFGELIAYGPQTGLVVSRAPPPPVAEIPPDERPADPRIVWVPGYWTWDDDRGDFTWVSGCWRFPPPGCSWVPGYWVAAPAGFQWVAGFWIPATAQQIVYLPSPPASVEAGPPGLPPADTYIWVPGFWAWNGFQYVWQPGYWSLAQADWVWVPAHYVYAPRGCIFVAGYWDHTIMRRGILFAPVYFGRGVYLRAGFRYSPVIVIDTGLLVINLFARPQYSHYYFGDYYDVRFAAMGIHPWFESRERRGWYDPIAVHEEWRRRHDDPMWERRERERFERLRNDMAARPAHTFAAQQAEMARLPKAQRQQAEIAKPLSQVVDRPPAQMRFEKINEQERQQIERQATEVHKYGEARAKWETPPAPAGAKPGTQRTETKQPVQRIAPPTAVVQPAATVAPTAKTVLPPTVVRQPTDVRQPPATLAPPTTGRRPETTVTQPTVVRQPTDVRQPPTTLAPPTAVRRPETTVTPPTVVAPPKAVAPPKEIRQPVLPPGGILRPEQPAKDVRSPTAPVGPAAPPATVRRPEEIRQPPAPEKVNIPKSPITSKPLAPQENPPPRPEPPKAEPPKTVAPVAPTVRQPEPPRTIAPVAPTVRQPEPPRTIAPAPPRAEQPGPVRGKEDEKDKDERKR